MTETVMTMDEFDELTAPPVALSDVLRPGLLGPETAYRTAYDLLAQRFPVEALDLVEPALAQEPNNAGLRTLRAWAYLLRAQLTRAEEDLRWLVEADPSDVWARHVLGRALERQSRYEDALPHLRLAAAMSDDYDHVAAVYRVERLIASRAE